MTGLRENVSFGIARLSCEISESTLYSFLGGFETLFDERAEVSANNVQAHLHENMQLRLTVQAQDQKIARLRALLEYQKTCVAT
jgi:hypothetical protein